MTNKIVWNKVNGNAETAYSHPLRKDEFVLPENTTEVEPPVFDKNTHTCSFDGNQWLVVEIPVIAPEPELEPEKDAEPDPMPEPLPAMDQLRMQRNSLLIQSDWRMNEDYPYADKEQWKTYRQELRNLPANSTPALDENGKLTGVNWPTPPST